MTLQFPGSIISPEEDRTLLKGCDSATVRGLGTSGIGDGRLDMMGDRVRERHPQPHHLKAYRNGHRLYVHCSFSRTPAECSVVSLRRLRYGSRYHHRGRRLSLGIDCDRRIYVEQVTKILGTAADLGHPSHSSRRRRHCRPSWVVGNDAGSVFAMRVILGLERE